MYQNARACRHGIFKHVDFNYGTAYIAKYYNVVFCHGDIVFQFGKIAIIYRITCFGQYIVDSFSIQNDEYA